MPMVDKDLTSNSLKDKVLRQVRLRAEEISKRYGDTVANDNITIELTAGAVNGLLGQNGSGKTTFARIISGMTKPDSGRILIGNVPVRFQAPRDAMARGIYLVHQHFSLVDTMTVAENVLLGWLPEKRRFYNERTAIKLVGDMAEMYGFDVVPTAVVGDLSVGERQRVEILKALYRGSNILILDEPTAVLTPKESRKLFEIMASMTERGATILFISHKLDEVVEVCHRVYVLRAGRLAHHFDMRQEKVSERDLARAMLGGIEPVASTQVRSAPGSEEALVVKNLAVRDEHGVLRVKNVSFSVKAGSIVGVVGVAGNGQKHLTDAIYGMCSRSGEVYVGGIKLAPANPLASLKLGMAYVPEDRFSLGLVPNMTVLENLAMKKIALGMHCTGPYVNWAAYRREGTRNLETYKVEGRLNMRVGELSGGNAQKVLLAREFGLHPKVLIVASPTRGLDIAATRSVLQILDDMANTGTGILVVSEDLDEVLEIADEVHVLFRGEIVGSFTRASADPDRIGLLMGGSRS